MRRGCYCWLRHLLLILHAFLTVSANSFSCCCHPFDRMLASKGGGISAKRMRSSSTVAFDEEFVVTVIANVPSLTAPILAETSKILSNFIAKWEPESAFAADEESSTTTFVSQCAPHAAAIFRRVAAGNAKLKTRKELQRAALYILGNDESSASVASVLALSLVLATLALTSSTETTTTTTTQRCTDRVSSRSAASAIASTLGSAFKKNESLLIQHGTIFEEFVYALIHLAATTTSCPLDTSKAQIDLHIVTSLARSVQVSRCSTQATAEATAITVRHALRLLDDDGEAATRMLVVAEEMADDDDDGAAAALNKKARVAAALALAAQLGPWTVLNPMLLVTVAVLHDLWHGAERICQSAVHCDGYEDAGVSAVHALIDAAFATRTYRQADNFATKFFDVGGKSRYLDARFLHACDTISKLIRKRALPVIERQVERVDKAVEKISAGYNSSKLSSEDSATPDAIDGAGTTVETASDDIRLFALRQLEENCDMDTAHRLAKIWNMEYAYDEEAMKAAVVARRQKYLQWDDLLPGRAVPDLLSTPESLDKAFNTELGGQLGGVYGFDVEWGDDGSGAALLQISTTSGVALLVDIPALSNSLQGADALERTVGSLFASPSCLVVGFGCRQDLSKLRSSPCARASHWLGETSAVIDLQPLVDKAVGTVGTGLSRCCEQFLLKPLDKAEQCSDWNHRPLSAQQQEYAVLDAYVCALIYSKHFAGAAAVSTAGRRLRDTELSHSGSLPIISTSL